VADYRASTPTDAAKRVVPDIAQELSDIEKIRDRMYRTLVSTIGYEINLIAQLRNRPVMKDPSVMVSSRRDEIKALRDRSIRSFASIIEIEKKEVAGVKAHLRSLSPQSTMDRGYSVVQLEDGSIVRDATKVKVGTRLRIRVAKGETTATVSSAE
jgi:exodeoxyribonuclease VII large subunit